jgi:hypothetical protein
MPDRAPKVRRGEPRRVSAFNRLLDFAASKLRLEVQPPLTLKPEGSGRVLSAATDDAIFAQLSGSTSPYSIVQKRRVTSTHTWATVTGGVSCTNCAYEISGQSGLGGKVVELERDVDPGSWIFEYNRYKPPCTTSLCFRFIGSGRNPVSGVTLTLDWMVVGFTNPPPFTSDSGGYACPDWATQVPPAYNWATGVRVTIAKGHCSIVRTIHPVFTTCSNNLVNIYICFGRITFNGAVAGATVGAPQLGSGTADGAGSFVLDICDIDFVSPLPYPISTTATATKTGWCGTCQPVTFSCSDITVAMPAMFDWTPHWIKNSIVEGCPQGVPCNTPADPAKCNLLAKKYVATATGSKFGSNSGVPITLDYQGVSTLLDGTTYTRWACPTRGGDGTFLNCLQNVPPPTVPVSEPAIAVDVWIDIGSRPNSSGAMFPYASYYYQVTYQTPCLDTNPPYSDKHIQIYQWGLPTNPGSIGVTSGLCYPAYLNLTSGVYPNIFTLLIQDDIT